PRRAPYVTVDADGDGVRGRAAVPSRPGISAAAAAVRPASASPGPTARGVAHARSASAGQKYGERCRNETTERHDFPRARASADHYEHKLGTERLGRKGGWRRATRLPARPQGTRHTFASKWALARRPEMDSRGQLRDVMRI